MYVERVHKINTNNVKQISGPFKKIANWRPLNPGANSVKMKI